MSWADYVNLMFKEQRDEENKVKFIKDGCCGGAIIGHSGPQKNAVYAQVGMALAPEVINPITVAVTSGNPKDAFAASGLKIGDTKYMFLNQPFEDCWAFKKGKLGASVAKCNTCYIIGISNDKSVVQSCTNNVNQLGKQLKSAGC